MRRLNIKHQQVFPFLCKDIYKISFLKLLTHFAQYFITVLYGNKLITQFWTSNLINIMNLNEINSFTLKKIANSYCASLMMTATLNSSFTNCFENKCNLSSSYMLQNSTKSPVQTVSLVKCTSILFVEGLRSHFLKSPDNHMHQKSITVFKTNLDILIGISIF